MIYKELDPFNSEDKFAKAGRAAEEQMAFYFKRFFGTDPEILVLNGIRLELEGDAAQVDHLIIHPHGLAIVESKSVHGKIQIKDDGQWIRWFNGNQSKGIASPITQARLQERFFRSVLGKASKNEALFAKLPIDLFVAISDGGVIVWPQSGPVQGVCKADQVPDKIVQSNQVRFGSALSSVNREKIAAFLVAANTPLSRGAAPQPQPQAAPVEPDAPLPDPIPPTSSIGSEKKCKHCGNEELEIRFAYTYFFFCRSCEKNTPIKAVCEKCQQPSKLRKQKKEFFLECEVCHTSTSYFTNP